MTEYRRQKEEEEGPETDELKTSEIVKAKLRDRLAKDKSANYTSSSEYQSLAMCMIDEDRITRDEHEESRKRWTTQRGFVYPAPRSKEEYSRHPRQLSQARQEDLRQPWIENQYLPKPLSREENGVGDKPRFDYLPSRDMVFAGLEVHFVVE